MESPTLFSGYYSWILLLHEFDLEIMDKAGDENVIVDHLFKLIVESPDVLEMMPFLMSIYLVSLRHESMNRGHYKLFSLGDRTLMIYPTIKRKSSLVTSNSIFRRKPFLTNYATMGFIGSAYPKKKFRA